VAGYHPAIDGLPEIAALCAALGDDRAAADRVSRSFADWWAARDPQAHVLLGELAARAVGEPAAMDVLLALIVQHGLSRGAIRRMLIDEHDIADAEQATLAVVALRVDTYEQRARFTTWLHEVAANEARMLIRSRSRRPSTPVAEPDHSPFLARMSTLVANRDLIDRAMADLPESLREPLRLREVEGLDYEEIGRVLGVPVGTVRSRLSRARAALADSVRRQERRDEP
jgi:RNA polymerase sigma-70 factor, ECF subfamily